MAKKNIYLFIVEEHHEAFIVWKYASINKLIKKDGNSLLHIDEHSDMGTPILNVSIESIGAELSKLLDFTYKELSIATFITPAIYEKIINKVFWIKQRHNKSDSNGEILYVRTSDEEKMRLVTGRLSQLKKFEVEKKELTSKAVTYNFYKQHITEIGSMKNVLLDIDLDYFSCIQDPLKKELLVEITEEEYLNFNNSPYHRMRFFDFGRVETKSKNNKFYYVLNHFKKPVESPLKVSEIKIDERIKQTVESLEKNNIIPQIITICRSRYSGYTPSDQWEYIEKTLIKELEEIYGIESIIHISELLN